MTDHRARILVILTAIAAATLMRLVPHLPNFSPIGAMALFSGAQLGRRPLAFAAPLGALLLSDAILGFYPGMAFQYLGVALVVLLGWAALSGRLGALRIAGAALAGSLVFFVVSNVGVWLVGGLYPLSLAGLGACFVAAMPFFQNSLGGDLFYAAIMFGGFALIERAVPSLRERTTSPA